MSWFLPFTSLNVYPTKMKKTKEIQERLERVKVAIRQAQITIARHGRNGLSALDNVMRLVDDVVILIKEKNDEI